MKAIILNQTGGVENLIVSEVPAPELKPQDVLVRVKAISINPVDAYLRANESAHPHFLQTGPDEKPIILGWDISGEVKSVGSSVTNFKEGDEVFGMVNFPGHGKAYAEYTSAPASQLAKKPVSVSFEEAAGATLAALTAYQSLVIYAQIKAGDKVLIHAAAGGVGHFAVQLAKAFGAYVIGTASSANRDFVLSLGADEFIDYQNEKFEEIVTDADIIIDSQYGNHVERSVQSLKKGGRLISLLTPVYEELQTALTEKHAFYHQLLVQSNGEDMQALAALMESGKLKTHVSKIVEFGQMDEAHRQIETRTTRGKVIVKGI
ncbi:NADP-dependent oxidoreductase [Paradesertivirga mongoliensis]|uniref:NADP-dependent oxidoreductase n=1 Tax=Paradesertivirga mongoliensis TaxID=2100740 RepID=A0ABW4ZRV3_9SPHI|nr:NADP-dependent oxidoreductase [Pedobacter mongoliensis]